MGSHIVDGEFQSDKYPGCPRGKVPLSVNDPLAQDLLWILAQRYRKKDSEFADDLETCLKRAGYSGEWLTRYFTLSANLLQRVLAGEDILTDRDWVFRAEAIVEYGNSIKLPVPLELEK